MDFTLPTRAMRMSVVPLVALAIVGPMTSQPVFAAAVTPNPVLCSTPGSLIINAQQGETFSITFSNCTGDTLTYDTSLLSASVSSGSALSGASIMVTFTVLTTAGLGLHLAAITAIQGGIGPSGNLTVTAASQPAPPPWFQAYARASLTHTCESTWHPSWAQWPNGRTGGPTCERTYSYDLARGMWRYE